jgi:hypothetical protein
MNPAHLPCVTDPMQGVERLSIVSKVLFDSRLIELRRENEALKLEQKRTIDVVNLQQKSRIDKLTLKNFWLQHDDLKLKEHLAMANDCYDGPNCRCSGCYWNGRFELANPQNRVLPGVNCTFMPWFENEIVDFDMTSSVGNSTEVTMHFATHVDGGCDLERWLLEIETCEHPEYRKVYELFSHFRGLAGMSDQSGDWEKCWS